MSIREALLDSRETLLRMVSDLEGDAWRGPLLPTVNPIQWEVGHVGWFHEHWCLRHVFKHAPYFRNADALYDSAVVPHDARWHLQLPTREATLDFLQTTLEEQLDTADGLDDEQAYFFWLSVFHEDMHGEAFRMARQTHRQCAPPLHPAALRTVPLGEPSEGDALVPGMRLVVGARRGRPWFAFDNERRAHPVDINAFRIAKHAVTYGQLAEFVDAGGYSDDRLWSTAGLLWRGLRTAPRSLRRDGDGWWIRQYDQWLQLPQDQAAAFVSYWEAEAFAQWAGRRLPTELEWEAAATGGDGRRYPWGNESPTAEHANLDGRMDHAAGVDAFPLGDSPHGCRQMLGNVWEWTSSDFLPYPGFSPDAYKEYSEPWFSSPHKVLRGGAFCSRSRLVSTTFRNFYAPGRDDLFAGFRTCARDESGLAP